MPGPLNATKRWPRLWITKRCLGPATLKTKEYRGEDPAGRHLSSAWNTPSVEVGSPMIHAAVRRQILCKADKNEHVRLNRVRK